MTTEAEKLMGRGEDDGNGEDDGKQVMEMPLQQALRE
jgi:hypothetical protein